MPGDRIRALRGRAGWTQDELAARAGVSRQLVSALEAGRHLPRVDAALSLAAALGVDVGTLFGTVAVPVDVVTGRPPGDGSPVRVGRVGDRTVVAAARVGWTGWDVADAVVHGGTLRPLGRIKPGAVVAGCEPGLEVLERLLRERGMGAVSVGCSSAAAVAALDAARVHAAVVHAGEENLPEPAAGGQTARFHLCRWQVGLAAPADAPSGWFDKALAGRIPVIQREPGAGVQATFERAAGPDVAGRRVGGHLEAARLAVASGMPAVTIEPAALAVGARFRPLEVHTAQLWVAIDRLDEPDVEAAIDELLGRRFRSRLEAVGGYDLAGSGTRAA